MTTTTSHRSPTQNTRRGFTLAEVVVSVAILAVVASALAAVFAAVGDTLSTGRRVSRLNTFAAQFVQVMQRDFEDRMLSPDRAGNGAVLVMRHEYAADGDEIRLAEADQNPRPRRVDQVYFLASGPFASARRSLVPGLEIAGDTAAIYYGHGLQQNAPSGTPDTVRTDPFFLPRMYDNNDNNSAISGEPNPEGVALGFGDDTIIDQPNVFASDWILARRPVVLVSPSGRRATGVVRNNLGFTVNQTDLDNSPVQYGLLPAAWSPFGALAGSAPRGPILDGFTNNPQGLYSDLSTDRMPQIESGLVDIAYSSPAEIGQFLRTAHVRSFDIYPSDRDQRAEVFYNTSMNMLPYAPTGFMGFGYLPGLKNESREIMQSWMLDLLPGESWSADWEDWSRMRVEELPTRALPADDEINELGGALQDIASTDESFVRDLIASDQEMLTSANYVPRCTEFIVEWSYGQIDRTAGPNFGQIIWYGLPRWDDRDNDGTRDPDEPWIARHYLNNLGQTAQVARPGYDERLPLTNLVMPGASPGTLARDTARMWRNQTFTDVFFDQRATPIEATYATSLFAGGTDPQPWEGATLPTGTDVVQQQWVWPRLIRVTISFADPDDPLVETSVQAVFSVPGEGLQ